MGIKLNTVLAEAGLDASGIRLLRHKDNRASKGRTPYELWRDSPAQFDLYQSTQSFQNREKLKADYWASFVATPADETMFVGIYRSTYKCISTHDIPKPHMDGIDPAGTCDIYDLELQPHLVDLIGKLIIDWGPGGRAWIQHADRQNKNILEVRTCGAGRC